VKIVRAGEVALRPSLFGVQFFAKIRIYEAVESPGGDSEERLPMAVSVKFRGADSFLMFSIIKGTVPAQCLIRQSGRKARKGSSYNNN